MRRSASSVEESLEITQARPSEYDRSEDESADEELDPEQIGIHENQAVVDERDKDHGQHGSEDRSASAGKRRATDDRAREGWKDPTHTDGRLALSQLGHEHRAGNSGEKARDGVRRHDA